MDAEIQLVVVEGPDAGARMTVRAKPALIGRGREAELQLTDRKVSRQHVQARLEHDKVVLQLLDGAPPMRLGDERVATAALGPGDRITIGATTLLAELAGENEERTDLRTLLSSPQQSAAGLAAIFELSEALEQGDVEPVLRAWSTRYVARDAKAWIEEQAGPSTHLVERKHQGGLDVTVPLTGAGSLALRLQLGAAELDADRRMLLAVAGRTVAASLLHRRELQRVESLCAELRTMALGSASAFLGDSPGAAEVVRIVSRLASSDVTALILGETGSGKTFVARLIHEAGARSREPLRIINCAAIPEHLVEAELFGHEKGAFTGAQSARAGALEATAAGTVLLDEIGDMPLASQAKLLRVLEDKCFERIGSNRTMPLRARVLAATNQPLDQRVAEGRFRADLFYRVSAVSLVVPSLRQRRDDIRMLAGRFLADLAPSVGRRVEGFSPAAIAVLEAYAWPGNVRELRNVIEHALVLGDGPLVEPSDLPATLTAPQALDTGDADLVRLPLALAALERRAIAAALRSSGGNRAKAAAILGIDRVTLYRKLQHDPES